MDDVFLKRSCADIQGTTEVRIHHLIALCQSRVWHPLPRRETSCRGVAVGPDEISSPWVAVSGSGFPTLCGLQVGSERLFGRSFGGGVSQGHAERCERTRSATAPVKAPLRLRQKTQGAGVPQRFPPRCFEARGTPFSTTTCWVTARLFLL